MLKKLSLLSVATVSAFAMHTFEININEYDLGLSAKFDIGQFNTRVEPGTTFVGAKYLKGSLENGDFKEKHSFAELNFLKVKEISDTGMSLGLGVKANTTEDFVTVPLGLEMVYCVPNVRTIPITINGSIYYAPTVLSFKDAEKFLEVGANIRFEIIENGLIVLGYRKIDTTYTKKINYNDSAYLGFKFAF